MFLFPGAKFSIAEGIFFSFVIENEKGLRPLGEEGDVDEWRVRGEKGAAAFDSDIEEDVGRRRQNGVGGEPKQPECGCLGDAVAGTDLHTPPTALTAACARVSPSGREERT